VSLCQFPSASRAQAQTVATACAQRALARGRTGSGALPAGRCPRLGAWRELTHYPQVPDSATRAASRHIAGGGTFGRFANRYMCLGGDGFTDLPQALSAAAVGQKAEVVDAHGRWGHHLADPEQRHDIFSRDHTRMWSSGSTVLSPSTRPRFSLSRCRFTPIRTSHPSGSRQWGCSVGQDRHPAPGS
jgi:hypothetical protein